MNRSVEVRVRTLELWDNDGKGRSWRTWWDKADMVLWSVNKATTRAETLKEESLLL